MYNESDENKNGDYRSEFDTKNYRSPNRQVISYKTENKGSKSRTRFDAEGVDESLDKEQISGNDQFETNSEFRDTNVEKPFRQINKNVGIEYRRSKAVLPK